MGTDGTRCDRGGVWGSAAFFKIFYFLFILFKLFSLHWSMCVLCAQLCDPTDCSLPGSSVHGISQERILAWVAIWSIAD